MIFHMLADTEARLSCSSPFKGELESTLKFIVNDHKCDPSVIVDRWLASLSILLSRHPVRIECVANPTEGFIDAVLYYSSSCVYKILFQNVEAASNGRVHRSWRSVSPSVHWHSGATVLWEGSSSFHIRDAVEENTPR